MFNDLKNIIVPVECRIAHFSLPLHLLPEVPISQKSHHIADHISHQKTVAVGDIPPIGHRHIHSRFLQQSNKENPLRTVY